MIGEEPMSTTDILQLVDRLAQEDGREWRRAGSTVFVKIGDTERLQRIDIERRGAMFVFRSVVVDDFFVRKNHRHWRRLAYRVWRKNAVKELVAFAFDKKDQLVGVIEQPATSLDSAELVLYIETLAKECDRFEYVLTGEDVE